LIDAALIPYLSLYLAAGLPGLLGGKSWKRVGWPIVWMIFVLFIGLRHQIGGDWGTYVAKAERLSELSFVDAILVQDPLFSALSWISSAVGLGVYGANLVGAAVFCTGLFSFCARQSNRWLALCAATPFLVVASVMSASRQGIAIGVFLLVVSYWKELSLRRRVIGIVIAGLFHSSAFVFLILTIVDLRIGVIRKALLATLAVAGTLWLMSISETGLTRYTELYVLNQTANSPGALFHLMLNLVPALAMLMTRKWWANALPNWPLLQILCYMAVAMVFLVPFYSQAVGRMSLYLFPVSITFFACLPLMTKNSAGRTLVRLGSVISLMIVLAVWVGFSNQSYAYRPYQNVITTNSDELDLR